MAQPTFMDNFQRISTIESVARQMAVDLSMTVAQQNNNPRKVKSINQKRALLSPKTMEQLKKKKVGRARMRKARQQEQEVQKLNFGRDVSSKDQQKLRAQFVKVDLQLPNRKPKKMENKETLAMSTVTPSLNLNLDYASRKVSTSHVRSHSRNSHTNNQDLLFNGTRNPDDAGLRAVGAGIVSSLPRDGFGPVKYIKREGTTDSTKRRSKMSRLSAQHVTTEPRAAANAYKKTGVSGGAGPEINIEEPDDVQVLQSHFEESPIERDEASDFEESPLRLRNAVLMRSSDFNYNSFQNQPILQNTFQQESDQHRLEVQGTKKEMRLSHAIETSAKKFNLYIKNEKLLQRRLLEDDEQFSLLKNYNQDPSSWPSHFNSWRAKSNQSAVLHTQNDNVDGSPLGGEDPSKGESSNALL